LAAASAESKDVAAQLLASCSNAFAEEKVAEWWKMAWSLFAKFGRYAVTHNETSETLQEYPQWWMDSIEVGFTMWAPEGPFHGELMTASASKSLSSQGSAFARGDATLVVLAAIIGMVGYVAGLKQGARQQARNDDAYVCLSA